MPDKRLSFLIDDETAQQKIREYIELEFSKLDDLSVYYGVPSGEYARLALALARDFVPGFQPAKKGPGRPKKWTYTSLGILYADMRRTMYQHDLPDTAVTSAAKLLARQTRWQRFLDRIEGSKNRDFNPAETLRQAYHRAEKKSYGKIFWDAFRYDELTGSVDEFEALADSLLFDPPRE